MDVTLPGRRLDVLAALDRLAAPPSAPGDDGHDPGGVGLTDAVHWVVDDTWWDRRDPRADIGTVLASEAEADAARAVVVALLDVASRQGATGSDRAWLGDERWPDVRELAAAAALLMRGGRAPTSDAG